MTSSKAKRPQKERLKLGGLCCRGGHNQEADIRPSRSDNIYCSESVGNTDDPVAAVAAVGNATNSNDARSPEPSAGTHNNTNHKPSENDTTAVQEVQPDIVTQVTDLSRLALLSSVAEDDLQDLLRLHDQFREPLLGPQRACDRGKKTLVLDLDETLVHSSFQPVPVTAFIVPIELENVLYKIYVAKRPGVEEFIDFCAELYEVVIFTASLEKYADPLLDQIDPQRKCFWRLCREACLLWQGNYIKDLSKLGRELKNVLIVDNSPASSILQPDNAIPIRTWFDDPDDRELYELMPILKALSRVENIQAVMRRTAACESDESDF